MLIIVYAEREREGDRDGERRMELERGRGNRVRERGRREGERREGVERGRRTVWKGQSPAHPAQNPGPALGLDKPPDGLERRFYSE
jgi:hypothetical protein